MPNDQNKWTRMPAEVTKLMKIIEAICPIWVLTMTMARAELRRREQEKTTKLISA